MTMSVEFPERFNMGDYFLYHNVEEGRENKVCLFYRDEEYTYADAVRMSNRAGRALRESGVRVEDRVLIALPDCPEFVWTWFGANRVGGVITMVNPLLPAEDYKYYLEYTRARVAVVHESLLGNFTEAAGAARHRKNSRPPTRTATTSPSGSSPPARPAARRARCTSTTTCPSTPSATPSACSA